MTETYHAVQYTQYGGPEVLGVVELQAPHPGPREVLVRVLAAGVNPIAWKLRTGALAAMMPVEFPAVPGGDVAGDVEETGDGVCGLTVGDEVFGSIGSGGYAELALAPAGQLARKPEAVSWEVAAALPVAANTAYQALTDIGLKPGETLVVDGAAGGVGTVTVQLARHLGATVIGTSSEHNHEYLRSLTAEPVTYGDGLAERIRVLSHKGVDAALDMAGKGSLPALIDVVGGPERVATIAAFNAAELGVRFVSADTDELPKRLARAAALAASGEAS
ncbi:NADP-dependent oxidoreductase [Streptomyces sp. CoT10]|uniref:NADP-dependent oxidoreductase n=1 Tax=Streptomyces sp. CoT10 TaxID=2875762 RepID=UPI0027DEB073|nr:NADP-dependent oxidoreductase [Streptomyces sp. CoT10]